VEKEQGNRENLQNYTGQNVSFLTEVISWEKVVKFVIKITNNSTWFLIPNRNDLDIADNYAKRFKIEKLFQDLKSSAFDIEKTKIMKYDRVKRLVYLSAVCHALMVFLGHFIKFTKKLLNHWDIVIAFSNSEWPPHYSVLDQSSKILSLI
jgi:transposase